MKQAKTIYNFDKDTCDRCRITKEEAKKYPVETGINHPEYCITTSFYLGANGEVWCAKCHREKQLEDLFVVMDARDKKNREELEDILFGLTNYPELEPTPERIRALKSLNSKNIVILDMIKIWESGHGVLSKQERINAIKNENNKNKE